VEHKKEKQGENASKKVEDKQTLPPSHSNFGGDCNPLNEKRQQVRDEINKDVRSTKPAPCSSIDPEDCSLCPSNANDCVYAVGSCWDDCDTRLQVKLAATPLVTPLQLSPRLHLKRSLILLGSTLPCLPPEQAVQTVFQL
jgi:hypothetical protein